MSKLGFHISGKVDLANVARARPRVVVITDNTAALHVLHDALADQTLLIAGNSALGTNWGAFWHGPAGKNPDRALDLWWDAVQADVQDAPFAFWMGFHGPQERDLVPAFAAFETARTERLAEVGARVCLGNFRAGQPDVADSIWKEFLPACRAARLHGGVLGLEELGALYMWTEYGSNEWLGSSFRAERKFPEDWRTDARLCLHYRQVYADLLDPVGLGELPLVITGCGLGSTANHITATLSVDGKPTGGWQSCIPTWRRRDGAHDPEDFYVRQLQWYDAQIERDTMVFGAAVYAWCTGDVYDIDGRVAEMLLRHVAAGPHPAESLWPEPATAGVPNVMVAELRHHRPASSQAGDAGKSYYIAVGHPEIFDSLWQQGEPAAEAVRAILTWREVAGRFVLQTNDVEVWKQLYQYGQFLAQSLSAEIEGGEVDAPETGVPEMGSQDQT